jgi:hypothetical protein
MTAVDSGRQRRMAWALAGLAVVGLALTVLWSSCCRATGAWSDS